ncbi:MAG: tetratricopeptide repeat protein [Myxococcota bacterium]|nr:tetratricopeptide repeat protein [Myxococcota bacterium]
MTEPRERFTALAGLPDDRVDLAEAALWVAAEEYEDLDVPAYLERLDALADDAAPMVGTRVSPVDRVAELNVFLFRGRGFTGNQERYEDPRNSFLNEVLDRRVGLPITLSIVYMEVARRLGLPVRGIGFPGHFLAQLEGSPGVVIDAFFGRLLSAEDCVERLRSVLGPEAELVPEVHLRAATPKEILARLLSNLKQVYARSGDWMRALSCCDRILLLAPDVAGELRDRGLVYERLACFTAAAADLERALELTSDAEASGLLRERIDALRRCAGPLH